MSHSGSAALRDEQIAYNRARAAEFDALLPAGPPPGMTLLRQVTTTDRVLELVCGTGVWTKPPLRIGRQVTAVDAAPEMLAINARNVASGRVRYLRADLFAWEPDQAYGLVFMASWLSYVPPEALDGFLDRVRPAVSAGGCLIVVDQFAPKAGERIDGAGHAPPLRRACLYHRQGVPRPARF